MLLTGFSDMIISQGVTGVCYTVGLMRDETFESVEVVEDPVSFALDAETCPC